MKVGNLVKLSAEPFIGATGVIVRMTIFSGLRGIALPHVFISGRVLLFGRDVCEVISENR